MMLCNQQINQREHDLFTKYRIYFMKKKTFQIVGSKFIEDTQAYRSIHPRNRLAQLKSILNSPKSNQYYQGNLPKFPIQYGWQNQNKKLSVVSWLPTDKPKALIVAYHCLNGHARLSSKLAQRLSKNGCVFTSFDYPNFGKSEGKQRGHIESTDSLIECCSGFLAHAQNKHPNIPTFLLGYSLGGLMAFHVGLKNQSNLNGCIFLNPSLQDNIAANQFLKKLVILSSLFFPKLKVFKPTGGRSSKYLLTKYKEKDDLMYHGKLWTSTSSNILTCMMKSRFIFHQFSLPYLYIQGGTDKTVNPFIAFDFQKQSKSQDKEIVIIHDMWHSVWFDDRLSDVIQMNEKWINQRI